MSRQDFLSQTNSSFTKEDKAESLEFASITPGGGGGNRFALGEGSRWLLPSVQELLDGVALSKEPIRNSTDHFVCIILENADKPGNYKKFPVGYFTDNLFVVKPDGSESKMVGFDGNETNRMRPVGGIAQAWQQVPGEMVAYAAYRALSWAEANHVHHIEIAKKLDVTCSGFGDDPSRVRACHAFKCVGSDGTTVVRFSPENMPQVDPATKIKEAVARLKGATGSAPSAGDNMLF